ncbi:MAG: hypothetical protein HYZ72_11445 [Deltaproteobacteria bacterium]|nr:hypothetical protein [Deltaproteobacteria bacterium]
MPLGNVLGEFTLKVMSVRQSDIGGGQVRIEVDLAGEGTGQLPGQNIGTLAVVVGGDTNRPNPYTYTGTLLAASGAVVRVSSWGIGVRTGEGHKIRYRGAVCYATDDPKLAAFNNVIAATEAEADPATMTLKGANCEWK